MTKRTRGAKSPMNNLRHLFTIAAVLLLALVFVAAPASAEYAQNTEAVSYIYYEYNTADNPASGIKEMKTEEKAAETSNVLTSSNAAITLGTSNTETWYVVDGSITIGGAVTTIGNVNIILKNNSHLTVTGNSEYGIHISSGSLTIYAQSTAEDKMGKLTVTSAMSTSGNTAGIYAEKNYALFINGGNITITGNVTTGDEQSSSYGIYAKTIVINGANVTSTAKDGTYNSCAIFADGDITISKSTVRTTGNVAATGTTGTYAGRGASSGIRLTGDCTIIDSIVSTTAGTSKMDSIGLYVASKNLVIKDSTVEATGVAAGFFTTGIHVYKDITLESSMITATSGEATGVKAKPNAAIISRGGKITIIGGTVIATSGEGKDDETMGIAAYGDVKDTTDWSITIKDGAKVTATAGNSLKYNSSGIYSKGSINLYNSDITATAGTAGEGKYAYGIYAKEKTTIAENLELSGTVGGAAFEIPTEKTLTVPAGKELTINTDALTIDGTFNVLGTWNNNEARVAGTSGDGEITGDNQKLPARLLLSEDWSAETEPVKDIDYKNQDYYTETSGNSEKFSYSSDNNGKKGEPLADPDTMPTATGIYWISISDPAGEDGLFMSEEKQFTIKSYTTDYTPEKKEDGSVTLSGSSVDVGNAEDGATIDTAKITTEGSTVVVEVNYDKGATVSTNGGTSVTGEISSVVAVYPATNVDNNAGVDFAYELNIGLNPSTVESGNIPLPVINPAYDATVAAEIAAKTDAAGNAYEPLAMIKAEYVDGIDKVNNNITGGVELKFIVPASAGNSFVAFHIGENGDVTPLPKSQVKILPNTPSSGYTTVVVTVDHFSGYAIAKGTYTVPQSSSGSSGSSVWLTEPVTPTDTPTEQPTQTPTDVAPTDIPSTQPTSEPSSPGFGVLAVLAGLGAVAVLRRR